VRGPVFHPFLEFVEIGRYHRLAVMLFPAFRRRLLIVALWGAGHVRHGYSPSFDMDSAANKKKPPKKPANIPRKKSAIIKTAPLLTGPETSLTLETNKYLPLIDSKDKYFAIHRKTFSQKKIDNLRRRSI
jgi:hypothetical protein